MRDVPAGSKLALFFTSVVPFLRGEGSADGLLAALGPSPSGRARVELYPWLVQGSLDRILDDLFPALRAACELIRPGLFRDLQREYAAAQPPRHFELYRWGEGLSDFVAEWARREALPGHLEEVADFHYTRYRLLTADVAPHEQRLDETLHVRQYAFETPAFVVEAERGVARAAPAAVPKVYVLYRSLHDGTARWLVPTTPMLLAVTRFARPGAAPAALTAEVGDHDLERAQTTLRERGVLP